MPDVNLLFIFSWTHVPFKTGRQLFILPFAAFCSIHRLFLALCKRHSRCLGHWSSPRHKNWVSKVQETGLVYLLQEWKIINASEDWERENENIYAGHFLRWQTCSASVWVFLCVVRLFQVVFFNARASNSALQNPSGSVFVKPHLEELIRNSGKMHPSCSCHCWTGLIPLPCTCTCRRGAAWIKIFNERFFSEVEVNQCACRLVFHQEIDKRKIYTMCSTVRGIEIHGRASSERSSDLICFQFFVQKETTRKMTRDREHVEPIRRHFLFLVAAKLPAIARFRWESLPLPVLARVEYISWRYALLWVTSVQTQVHRSTPQVPKQLSSRKI